MIDLTNQVAVVSGGSRGIGAAAGIMLAQAGCDVVITYRKHRKQSEEVVSKILSFQRKGKGFRCSVERYSDCAEIVTRVIRDFGRIDILVNSAGVWEESAIETMSYSSWKRTIEINLTGTFNMCRAVVPGMKIRGRGKIINVSSTAGQRGESNHSHYAASKGGVIAFTKSLGSELMPHGIRVNCVAPGWVETDMTKSIQKNKKAMKRIIESIPRGRMANPEEIAGPILFLASSLSDHVVGEILNVNGGSVLCG